MSVLIRVLVTTMLVPFISGCSIVIDTSSQSSSPGSLLGTPPQSSTPTTTANAGLQGPVSGSISAATPATPAKS